MYYPHLRCCLSGAVLFMDLAKCLLVIVKNAFPRSGDYIQSFVCVLNRDQKQITITSFHYKAHVLRTFQQSWDSLQIVSAIRYMKTGFSVMLGLHIYQPCVTLWVNKFSSNSQLRVVHTKYLSDILHSNSLSFCGSFYITVSCMPRVITTCMSVC